MASSGQDGREKEGTSKSQVWRRPFSSGQPSTSSSSERLPSMKKRDLTLNSTAAKKIFSPTIPPQRIKKELVSSDEVPASSKKSKARDLSKTPRGRGQRGRGRGREVITTPSVFSMGPADRKMGSRGQSLPAYGHSHPSNIPSHPSANATTVVGRVKREGFTSQQPDEPMDTSDGEDCEVDPFKDSLYQPIFLPLDYGLHGIKEKMAAANAKANSKILPSKRINEKISKTDDDMVVGGLDTCESEVKSTAVATGGKENLADPVGIADRNVGVANHELGVAKHEMGVADHKVGVADETQGDVDSKTGVEIKKIDIDEEVGVAADQEGVSISQLFSQPDDSKAKLLMFQLPDILTVTEAMKCVSLSEIKEAGFVGKLKVHKSGKVKLHIGGVVLDVAMGTPCAFRQDLVAMDAEEKQLTHLGVVSHKITCTPNLDDLLSSV